MPYHPLSEDEKTHLRAGFAAGESDAVIAARLGRSRQTVARHRASDARRSGRTLTVKLNFRLTQEEHAAFQAVIEARRLTVSEAIRHLVRQASGLLAIQAGELEAVAAARRDLAAVGNNLNQLARLGAIGKLVWKPGDAALVRKLANRVEALTEAQVVLLAAMRARRPFQGEAAVPGATDEAGVEALS